MATKTKKVKKPVPPNYYQQAKQLCETMEVGEAVIVEEVHNVEEARLFQKYMREHARARQKEFSTKMLGAGLRVIRIS